MLGILTEIENNEYTRTQLLRLLTEHTSRVHSSSEAKGGKSKKSKKSRKSKKSKKSKKTRKSRK